MQLVTCALKNQNTSEIVKIIRVEADKLSYYLSKVQTSLIFMGEINIIFDFGFCII